MQLFNWSLPSVITIQLRLLLAMPLTLSVVRLTPSIPIDNVLKDALTKLKVSVRVDDVDWKKIQDMFDKQHEWMTTQMQKHIREVNQMFMKNVEGFRKVQGVRRNLPRTLCAVFLLVLLCPWTRYFRPGYLPDARQSLPLDDNLMFIPSKIPTKLGIV